MKLFSRKLWMTVFVLLVLCSIYWWQVDYLFSFIAMIPTFIGEPEVIIAQLAALQGVITAYSGLTRDIMVAITAALGAYLGIAGLVQWKHGTEAVVSQVSESLLSSNSNIQKITEEFAQKFKGEQSYRPANTLLDADATSRPDEP